MKVCCLVLSAGLAACAVGGPVEVGGLPAWSLADTEVSTNVPVAFPPANVKHLLATVEFAGTPSNNVQVAFGCDVNTNGVLEIDETGLVVGWDCGRWMLRGGEIAGGCLAADRAWTADEMTTNRVKRLEFDLGVSNARSKRLFSSENGVPLDWPMPSVPRDLYDRSWNMLRLTVRGVDVADESLRAELRVAGTVISIR